LKPSIQAGPKRRPARASGRAFLPAAAAFLAAAGFLGPAAFFAAAPAALQARVAVPGPVPASAGSPQQDDAGSPEIKVDQVGFLPGEAKLAMLTAAPGGAIEVRRASDQAVLLRVTAGPAIPDPASGDSIRAVDFSALSACARCVLAVPGVGVSAPFTVGPGVYRAPWRLLMRAFYAQRCGSAVDLAPDYPGYRHAACHLDDAVYDASAGRTGRRPASGGWHDAGDYGKYVVNADISVGELLMA
jgi:endoglucanase